MFNFKNVANGINSRSGRLIYIEVSVLSGAIGLLALLILGFCRRFSSSVFVQLPIVVADALSYILVSYTIGLMHSFTFGNELFAVWAVCLVMVLASADSISAVTLRDSGNWKTLCMMLTLKMYWVSWLWVSHVNDSRFIIPTGLLILVSLYRTHFRVVTLRWVSGSGEFSLTWRTKVVADYMHGEDQVRKGGNVDPVCMAGYNYLVCGEHRRENEESLEPVAPEYTIRVDPDNIHVITLDKIWRCKDELLDSIYHGNKLKDICLSYALAKLLCRRFFDYELAEKDLPKTRDLVLSGLLSQDDNPERAFRVIEVEISFIYDLFYTKYPLIFHFNHLLKVLSLGSLGLLLWLPILLFRCYNNPNDQLTLIRGHRKNYDALITLVIVIIIFFFEFLQIYFYLASDWVKVSLVCNYVKKSTCKGTLRTIVSFVCWLKNLTCYWQRKISQYSLLDSYDYQPKRNYISCIADNLIDRRRKGQKEGDSMNLSETVKKAILRSLRISNGCLSNGKASLERNEVGQLSEAFIHRNHAQSILIWHIATTLCMQHNLNRQTTYTDDNDGGQGNCLRSTLHGCIKRVNLFFRRNCSRNINQPIGDHYEIAISLSNYCAYLVAFAPKFLPDQSYDTEVMFDAVVKEANNTLGEEKSCMTRLFDKMMRLGEEVGANDSVVKKGALLGKKLIEEIESEEKRWKVLADYWAEMILFIAPSNNATVHFEKLAEGGELITHLWALLTHAGIVEREAETSTA